MGHYELVRMPELWRDRYSDGPQSEPVGRSPRPRWLGFLLGDAYVNPFHDLYSRWRYPVQSGEATSVAIAPATPPTPYRSLSISDEGVEIVDEGGQRHNYPHAALEELTVTLHTVWRVRLAEFIDARDPLEYRLQQVVFAVGDAHYDLLTYVGKAALSGPMWELSAGGEYCFDELPGAIIADTWTGEIGIETVSTWTYGRRPLPDAPYLSEYTLRRPNETITRPYLMDYYQSESFLGQVFEHPTGTEIPLPADTPHRLRIDRGGITLTIGGNDRRHFTYADLRQPAFTVCTLYPVGSKSGVHTYVELYFIDGDGDPYTLYVHYPESHEAYLLLKTMEIWMNGTFVERALVGPVYGDSRAGHRRQMIMRHEKDFVAAT